jgi:hypothetical protein
MDILTNFFKNSNYNKFYNSIDPMADKCMICNLPYNDINKVTLDCNHIYHNCCVNLLLKNTPLFVCPYCKAYQEKYKIISTCKYVTKQGKKCMKTCLSDIGICPFHSRYLKSDICFGIYKTGKNKGKRCCFKPKKNELFCKIHLKSMKFIK